MNEPKTSVTINDFTVGVGVDPVDSRLNILCPIISPAGPTELTRVTGPSMLKRLYFGGRSIKTSDNYSAVFARALSANAPIYVKRGTRDTLKGGKSSALGEVVYVDYSLNPIRGIKAKFSQGEAAKTYETALEELRGVITDSSVYTSDTLSDDDLIIVDGSVVSGVAVKKSMTLLGANTEAMMFTVGNRTYTIPEGTSNFNDFVLELAIDGYCPQSVRDASGTVRFEYRNGVPAIEDGKNITTVQWLSDISIIPSDDYAGYITITENPVSTSLNLAKIKTKEEYEDTYPVSNADILVTLGEGADATVYAFYTDSTPTDGDVKVKLGNNLSFYEIMQSLTRQVAELFGGDSSVGNSIIIPNAFSVSASDTGNILNVSSSSLNVSQYNDKFAVVSAFPCSTDAIKVSISKNSEFNSEVYIVEATYSNGDISESWNICFDSGVVDGYGDSLYYQRVNDDSQLIRIVELFGDNVSTQTFNIGSQVSSEYCGTPEIIDAYEKIVTTEEADVMFDYITDGGIIDSSLSKYIVQMCNKYHSYYPASVPVDTTLTESVLRKRRGEIGDYFAMNCIGASQRAALLDSGSAVYPASYYYLARRIDLGNTSSEFMPIFAQSSGDINMQKPLQRFDAETRERLLDLQIPTLKREATGLYCLNLNLTCYKLKSYMQEDGIALMINKINQIADIYAKSVISMPNTDRTRASIQSSLTNSINGRLRVGTEYGPQSIRVQCDRSNNPQSLIDQWKVRVDIYATFANSIREVLIYTNVLPLQQ